MPASNAVPRGVAFTQATPHTRNTDKSVANERIAGLDRLELVTGYNAKQAALYTRLALGGMSCRVDESPRNGRVRMTAHRRPCIDKC
jgi:hypothetical protein